MAVMCHGPHFRIDFRQDENDPEIHLKIVLAKIHNQNRLQNENDYFGWLVEIFSGFSIFDFRPTVRSGLRSIFRIPDTDADTTFIIEIETSKPCEKKIRRQKGLLSYASDTQHTQKPFYFREPLKFLPSSVNRAGLSVIRLSIKLLNLSSKHRIVLVVISDMITLWTLANNESQVLGVHQCITWLRWYALKVFIIFSTIKFCDISPHFIQ